MNGVKDSASWLINKYWSESEWLIVACSADSLTGNVESAIPPPRVWRGREEHPIIVYNAAGVYFSSPSISWTPHFQYSRFFFLSPNEWPPSRSLSLFFSWISFVEEPYCLADKRSVRFLFLFFLSWVISIKIWQKYLEATAIISHGRFPLSSNFLLFN